MLRFFGKTKIDFVSKRHFFYALSLIVIAYGSYQFIKKGDTAFGIDFAGGQVQEYRFQKAVKADNLREALKKVGLEDAVIQQFDKTPENVIIRTSAEDTTEKVMSTFKETLPDNSFEVLRIEKVGPVVGKALRKQAILAIVFALTAILIYVGFRFKHFDFAVAGIVALLHDVLIAMLFIVVLGRQIDLLVVTALMTIAGYSINDTIVIYDRIRENLVKMRKSSLTEIINVSLNETLSRTILTSSATLMVVFALFFKGGEVLNTFSLCLIIGFLSGVYSTVFIALPLVLAFQKKTK